MRSARCSALEVEAKIKTHSDALQMVSRLVLDRLGHHHARGKAIRINKADDSHHLLLGVGEHGVNQCGDLDLALGRVGVRPDVSYLPHLEGSVELREEAHASDRAQVF